jgi:hypothetical protein
MKRFSIILLALITAASIPLSSSASDVHWADETFKLLHDAGLIGEAEFTTADYDDPITRGRFVNVFMRLFDDGAASSAEGISSSAADSTSEAAVSIAKDAVTSGAVASGDAYFTDVDKDSEYYLSSARAKTAGYITGHEDGSFRPDSVLKRQELFTIVGRTLGGNSAGEMPSELPAVPGRFADEESISPYAKGFIEYLAKDGIILGYDDNTIRPAGIITCAEAMSIIKRLKTVLDEKQGSAKGGTANSTSSGAVSITKSAITTPAAVTPGGSGGSGSFGGGGSGGGGGNNSAGSGIEIPKLKGAPPSINFKFSREGKSYEPLIVDISVGDDVSVKRVGYVEIKREYVYLYDDGTDTSYLPAGVSDQTFSRLYGKLGVYSNDTPPEAKIAEAEYGGAYSLEMIVTFLENSRGEPKDQTTGTSFDRYEKPDDYEDLTMPISDNRLSITQNGLYYVFAEDSSGNRTIKRLEVDHILTASASTAVTLTSDFSGKYIADVSITVLNENPNAPIAEIVLGKYVNSGILGGGLRSKESFNQRCIDEKGRAGYLVPYTDGKFSVQDYGLYYLYLIDAWGNYSREVVEINPPGDKEPIQIDYELSEPVDGVVSVTLKPQAGISVAKINYVKGSWYDSNIRRLDYLYVHSLRRSDRTPVEGLSFKITEKDEEGDPLKRYQPYVYVVCIYDTSGNVGYALINQYGPVIPELIDTNLL